MQWATSQKRSHITLLYVHLAVLTSTWILHNHWALVCYSGIHNACKTQKTKFIISGKPKIWCICALYFNIMQYSRCSYPRRPQGNCVDITRIFLTRHPSDPTPFWPEPTRPAWSTFLTRLDPSPPSDFARRCVFMCHLDMYSRTSLISTHLADKMKFFVWGSTY